MSVALFSESFDPWQAVQAHQATLRPGSYGAACVFVGSMRDFNAGRDGVEAMFLEHYPGMTERHLEKICDEAQGRWAVDAVLIGHRVGEVVPSEPIVVTAVWSAHRREAFEACRFLMEELKSRAPFWKKERLGGVGERWVEGNTAGY